MCGLIGGNAVFGLTQEKRRKALHALKHRGPDAQILVEDRGIFLGHARLSFVDIEGGFQPLYNEDVSVVCVVNGEFYNDKEIRQNLEKEGHFFRTQSDSEILVHLYEKYGVNCIHYLEGEFAFILYDFHKRKWFCARDRYGIRPLQYYHESSQFLIASEAKALKYLGIPIEFDRQTFIATQYMQYAPLDRTFFKNVYMIRPGHYLEYDEEKDILEEKKYWSPDMIVVNENQNDRDIYEKVDFLLRQSVKKRLSSNSRPCTHLSGGLDSSLITALVALSDSSVEAFTIKFLEQDSYDESLFAQQTAQKLGIKLHTIPVTTVDMLNALPQAVYHAEGLGINGHLGAKYILNQMIHNSGFRLALTGEGSDEIFMGYSHLKQDWGKAQLSLHENNYLSGVQLPSGDLYNLPNDICVPTWLKAKSSMAYKFQQKWSSEFKKEMNSSHNPYTDVLNNIKKYSTVLKGASGTWMQYALGGYILKILDDAQGMAHSVESRLPFLDHALVDFVLSIPEKKLFQNNQEKGLLRFIYQNFLPEDVIKRTKQSFMAPPRQMNNDVQKKWIFLWEKYVEENKAFNGLKIYDKSQLKTKEISHQNASDDPVDMSILTTGILVDHFFNEN